MKPSETESELPDVGTEAERTRLQACTAYLEELGPRERAAFMSWAGFAVTFGATRGITHSIRDGVGPFRNVSAGAAHLHHYLWGISLLTGVGAAAVHGPDERRRHPLIALSYGAGLALIVDEIAL